MPLCCTLARFAAHSRRPDRLVRPRQSLQWYLLSSSIGRRNIAVAEQCRNEQLLDVSRGDQGHLSTFDDAAVVCVDGDTVGGQDSGINGASKASSDKPPALRERLQSSHAQSGSRLGGRRVSDQTESEGRDQSVGSSKRQRRRSGETSLRSRFAERKRPLGKREDRVPEDKDARTLYLLRERAWRKSKPGHTALRSIRADTRNSAVHSSAWTTKLQHLARTYDKSQPDFFGKDVPALTFRVEAFERIDAFLQELVKGHASVNVEAFARQRGMIGREVWSEVALWLLCYQKESMFDFLRATNSPLYPPINWVEDCLCYLARHYSLLDDASKRSWLQQVGSTFLQLVPRDTNERWVFNQPFIRHILPHLSLAQIEEINQLVKTEQVKFTGYSLLHLADGLAKRDKLQQALSVLLVAKDAGANVDSAAFRSICATILRKSNQQPGGLRVCLRLIENLVAMGVKLNRHICNIVMLNAIEAGDIETMDAVHRSAGEQGIAPDAHTCAIRLKACKLNIHDSARLKQAIEEAISDGNIRENKTVAGEVLSCLTLQSLEDNEPWSIAFSKVATAYVELFDVAPMQRLGIDMPEAPPNTSGQPRLTPSRHIFTYLLSTYLRRGSSTEKAVELYNRYRELVLAGDPPFADCATTCHVSNVFLRRFVRRRDTLLQAAQVVKDMQKPLPATAGVQQAPPDVYTWSIFLHGFSSTGQTKLAEQVLKYMRARGIEPNDVTWTSLVGGYARSQDGSGLLDSLRRMQDRGAVFNEWTHRGLRKFKDRQRLREILEQQRLQQELDFTGDLKTGLGRRLSEPSPAEHVDETSTRVSGTESDLNAQSGFEDCAEEGRASS